MVTPFPKRFHGMDCGTGPLLPSLDCLRLSILGCFSTCRSTLLQKGVGLFPQVTPRGLTRGLDHQ